MSGGRCKVSAVITTHNRVRLLRRAIESVKAQTFGDMELIVVDDASTDGTAEYLAALHDVHSIHIPKEESRGGNHARNLGVKAARGEYVAFLDDDDYWLPEKTAKQVALMERMDCELVHCGKRLERVGGDCVSFTDALPNPEHWGDMQRKILTAITTTTSLMMVKRQALLDVGLFDENLRFWQEYELTIRLAQRKPFYFVNEPLCVYRVDRKDKGRLTNKYFAWREAVRYIHEKHAQLYGRLNPVERFQVWLLTLNDAQNRCLSAGLLGRHYCYKGLYKALHFPFRVVGYLRRRMGHGESRLWEQAQTRGEREEEEGCAAHR